MSNKEREKKKKVVSAWKNVIGLYRSLQENPLGLFSGFSQRQQPVSEPRRQRQYPYATADHYALLDRMRMETEHEAIVRAKKVQRINAVMSRPYGIHGNPRAQPVADVIREVTDGAHQGALAAERARRVEKEVSAAVERGKAQRAAAAAVQRTKPQAAAPRTKPQAAVVREHDSRTKGVTWGRNIYYQIPHTLGLFVRHACRQWFMV